MNKRIAILGSTGSIGVNALEVVRHLGPPFRVSGLSAHRQYDRLLAQAMEHRPTAVALTDEKVSQSVLNHFQELDIETFVGPGGMSDLVRRPEVDIVLAAIVGAAGLPACIAAIEAGKTLALANKEALVVAGSLLVPEARRRGTPIIPIDSEHSAIFQACLCGKASEIRRIILTASGGPFRQASAAEIERATVEDALNHPTWRMGSKITIDSATMFNKALEIIEACWLFDLPPEKIEVVIHPDSIVHSMVEFVDGSVMAQLSPPDMRTPIQYALTYPERRQGIGRRMNFRAPQAFHFEPPDPERFPALKLAYEVACAGGTAGAVLNAANEAAVEAFLAGRIRFVEISRLVGTIISTHLPRLQASPTLADLVQADRWARQAVESSIGKEIGADPDLSRSASIEDLTRHRPG